MPIPDETYLQKEAEKFTVIKKTNKYSYVIIILLMLKKPDNLAKTNYLTLLQ